MLAELLYPLHARYFAAGDSLRSSTPTSVNSLIKYSYDHGMVVLTTIYALCFSQMKKRWLNLWETNFEIIQSLLNNFDRILRIP
jgi:hypothetical protein